MVQRFLSSVLARSGCPALEVGPYRAVELLKTSDPDIRLVITNTPRLFLPFAGQIALLYIAACPDQALASRFPTCRVLHKPFRPVELMASVRELLESL
jgi:hypothetical protein